MSLPLTVNGIHPYPPESAIYMACTDCKGEVTPVLLCHGKGNVLQNYGRHFQKVCALKVFRTT